MSDRANDEKMPLHFMSSDEMLERWRMRQGDLPELTRDVLPRGQCDRSGRRAETCCVTPGRRQGETFLVWIYQTEQDRFKNVVENYVRLAPHPAILRFVGYCGNDQQLVVTEGDFSRICAGFFGWSMKFESPSELDATRSAKATFGVVAALVHMESHGIRPRLSLEHNIVFDGNWEVKVGYTCSNVELTRSSRNVSDFWQTLSSYGWSYTLVWFMTMIFGFDMILCEGRQQGDSADSELVRALRHLRFSAHAGVHPLLRSILESTDLRRCDYGLEAVPYTLMDIFQALLRLNEPLVEGVDMHEYEAYKKRLAQQTSGGLSVHVDRHFIGGANTEFGLDPSSAYGGEMERFMKIKYVMEHISEEVRRNILRELQSDLDLEHPNDLQATVLLAYGFSIARDSAVRSREIGAKVSHSGSHVLQYLSCFCGFDSTVEEDRREIFARIKTHAGSGNPFCMRVAATLAIGGNVTEFPFEKCYKLSVLPLDGARTDHHLADLVSLDRRFIVVQRVGEGRFGKVDWVIDRETFTSYALKKLRLDSTNDCPVFQRELENLRAVNHPCVIAIRGMIVPVGRSKPKILMDFMSDGTLNNQLDIWKRELLVNPYEVYFKMTLTICRIAVGLTRLHAKGLIHRDLKPSNILFASHEDGPMAVIGDLGSTRSALGSTLTHSEGTFRYKAPELYEQAEYGQQVDIFSFALIVYEILALEPFFDPALSDAQVMRQALSGHRPALSSKAAFRRVSPFMWELLQKGWSMSPSDRPSAQSIVFELERNDYKIFDWLPSHYNQRIVDHMKKFILTPVVSDSDLLPVRNFKVPFNPGLEILYTKRKILG